MPHAFAEWVALVAPYLTIVGTLGFVRARRPRTNQPTGEQP